MRIVGVDQVPLDAVRARRRAAQAGAHADADPHPQGQARAGGARPGRGGDLVVHRQGAGRAVRRRTGRSLRSPIRSRPICPTCGRASFRGWSTSAQKNADRGFADVALFEVGQIFKGDQPEDQFTAASGVRRALAQGRRRRPALVGGDGEADVFDAKADALAVLAAAGAPPPGAAGRARRTGLVSSGPLRHDPDRAAERARPFRRTASARARGARRRRPAGRVRGDPRAHPRAEGEADARKAGARTFAVPAGDARLRLRGRPPR